MLYKRIYFCLDNDPVDLKAQILVDLEEEQTNPALESEHHSTQSRYFQSASIDSQPASSGE